MKTAPVNTREQNAEKTEFESADCNTTSETLHLLGPSANAKRSQSSIAQIKLGNVITKELPISE